MSAAPQLPMDYVSAAGTLWVMAACGHRCGGGVTLGARIALCPNCRLRVSIGEKVRVVYPERLPVDLAAQLP